MEVLPRIVSGVGVVGVAAALKVVAIARAMPNLADQLRALIVAFLGQHPPWWTRERHWGACGQNCPCCRAENPEDWWSGCELCIDKYVLAAADRRWAAAVHS